MFLITAHEFGGTVSDIPKGLYYIESHKKRQKLMLGSTDVLFVFNTKTTDLTKHSYKCFREFTTISKMNHMKKLIEYQYVFKRYFMVRQEVNDEIQKSIYFIKDECQIFIENILSCKKRKRKSFWFHGDTLKRFLAMNNMEHQIIKGTQHQRI